VLGGSWGQEEQGTHMDLPTSGRKFQLAVSGRDDRGGRRRAQGENPVFFLGEWTKVLSPKSAVEDGMEEVLPCIKI